MKFVINRFKYARVLASLFVFFVCGTNLLAQSQAPELDLATMRTGHLWLGVTANGGKSNFDFTAGFFPNDWGIMANRGQYAEAYTGAGITLTATHWFNPLTDSVERVAVYSLVTDSLPIGKVTVPMTNYLRYKYPYLKVDVNPSVSIGLFGQYNPAYSEFQNHTFDQIIQVRDSSLLGITVDRKLMAWTQTYNNDYVISDLVFTNTTDSTLDSVYINIQESSNNVQYSYGSVPDPGVAFQINLLANWQHYYGGRPGDSMRVFYEYGAYDPNKAYFRDNMGTPVMSQNARLLNPNMTYYAILHASAQPYTNSADDVDDPLQPKVTYIGVASQIPFDQSTDNYGSKNFYAIRGSYSDAYPMPGSITGTHHGINNDEYSPDGNYYSFPAGNKTNVSYRFASFGPYTLQPGQKVHIVYASGFTGIGYKAGEEVGKKWLDGSLQDPPNMPDPQYGWFPQEFKFPPSLSSETPDQIELDHRKDRWISMGIDSVMLSAWRAKWNYDHNYDIPQAPPPPSSVEIEALPDGVRIKWSDTDAEVMPNFEGYRIMRRITNADTVNYSSVYDSDANDKAAEHVFIDTNVRVGAVYYYYIQAKVRIGQNDMNADPTTRGKLMYSSRALFPNYDYVAPTRSPQDDMSKIRVVPNPYNVDDPYFTSNQNPHQRLITFFNLPAFCTIKIYTENGDLVKTIDHNNGKGTQTWDLYNDYQQLVFSGVYIAVFQKPSGEVTYQKFIIVQ